MCELPKGWVILLGSLAQRLGNAKMTSAIYYCTQLVNVKVQLVGVKVQLLQGKVDFYH